MSDYIRRLWNVPQQLITDEAVYRARGWHRRQFLAAMGGGLAAVAGCQQKASREELQAATADVPPVPQAGESAFSSARNPKFDYGRPETRAEDAAVFTNFYEFTGPTSKKAYKYVGEFHPLPWAVVVDGLCDRPATFDMDDLYRSFTFEERAYRHRCVETWAMCVPWTGFPLADLIQHVGPRSTVKYVRFETFGRPTNDGGPGRDPNAPIPDSAVVEFDGQRLVRPTFAPFLAADDSFPWPYSEGLTIAEATNELAFLATGIYGKPLPKQHGAPVRLVVPWKYGFKSIKSIVRITLTDQKPATFWNTVAPREYDFDANVNPSVPHPRWSQRSEWMLGTGERYPTQIYNGYGEYVGGLYG